MHAFSLRLLALLLLLTGRAALAAPDASITTDGLRFAPLQINALVWTNRGTVSHNTLSDAASVGTANYLAPVFETQNTLRYVNRGNISAYPGLRYETVLDSGARIPAVDFINEAGRSISSEDMILSSLVGGLDGGNPYRPLYGGFITVNATNITNAGLISSAFGGDIRLTGENVDLRRGGVGNAGLAVSSFRDGDLVDLQEEVQFPVFAPAVGFFYPEIGVEDVFWFYGDIRVDFALPLGAPSLLGGVDETPFGSFPTVPVITEVFDRFTPFMAPAERWRENIADLGFRVFARTNQVNATNKIVEVAFVRTPDTNVLVDVGWTRSSAAPDNPHSTAWIRFSSFSTNFLTLQAVSDHLILRDNYSSEPSTELLNNLEVERAFRPTNLSLIRARNLDVSLPFRGLPPNADFAPELFTHWFDADYEFPEPPDAFFFPGVPMTNGAMVFATTNGYTTWAARVEALPSQVPVIPEPEVLAVQWDDLLERIPLNELPEELQTRILNDILNGGRGDEGVFTFVRDDFLGPERQPLPQASFTNHSGRVYVKATNLNLERARLQATGVLVVETDNLISARNAVLDAPIISLDLAKPPGGGELVVENLMRGTSTRLGGNLVALSYAFSNFFTLSLSNAPGTPIDTDMDGTPDACDTDGDGMPDTMEPCPEPVTGDITFNAFYHVTVVDSTIRAQQQQYVDRLRLRGDSVRIVDSALVQQNFFTDTPRLTVDGRLNFFGITNFNRTTAPNLEELTVNAPLGTIVVPSLLTLGMDRPGELKKIANAGGLFGSSVDVLAETVENSGLTYAFGGQGTIRGKDVTFNGPVTNANYDTLFLMAALLANDIELDPPVMLSGFGAEFEIEADAENLTLAGGNLFSGGEVVLRASASLLDGDGGAGTRITSRFGTRVPVRPPVSRLNGVTVATEVPDFAEAIHVWAGEDRGATRAGYDNNLAIQTLSLDAGLFSTLTFRGAGANNALYVETLDLTDNLLADLENALNIEPSLTLYYANTSGNVPPEILDGFITQGGGKLVWVKEGSPADPNRLVPVRLGDGREAEVPFWLRDSNTVDSDNDGIVNRLDASPFDPVMLADVKLNVAKTGVEVYWKALPGAAYEVQASDSLGREGWSKVVSVQNSGTSEVLLKAEDALGDGNSARIYRVIITP